MALLHGQPRITPEMLCWTHVLYDCMRDEWCHYFDVMFRSNPDKLPVILTIDSDNSLFGIVNGIGKTKLVKDNCIYIRTGPLLRQTRKSGFMTVLLYQFTEMLKSYNARSNRYFYECKYLKPGDMQSFESIQIINTRTIFNISILDLLKTTPNEDYPKFGTFRISSGDACHSAVIEWMEMHMNDLVITLDDFYRFRNCIYSYFDMPNSYNLGREIILKQEEPCKGFLPLYGSLSSSSNFVTQVAIDIFVDLCCNRDIRAVVDLENRRFILHRQQKKE